MGTDVAALRKEYTKDGLQEDQMAIDPMVQFKKWFEQALQSELTEPNAMIVGTVSPEGQSTQRTVLLKAYDEKGFVFYTNYESRKAAHIKSNNKVSLLFPWYPLERQLMIQGHAEKVSTKESFTYFTSRPKGSQLGAWVSQQSSVISSRKILEMKLEEMKRKFTAGQIPLPDFWGGFRVVPHTMEFWQGRPNRLHDRIEYSKSEQGDWAMKRLAP